MGAVKSTVSDKSVTNGKTSGSEEGYNATSTGRNGDMSLGYRGSNITTASSATTIENDDIDKVDKIAKGLYRYKHADTFDTRARQHAVIAAISSIVYGIQCDGISEHISESNESAG